MTKLNKKPLKLLNVPLSLPIPKQSSSLQWCRIFTISSYNYLGQNYSM